MSNNKSNASKAGAKAAARSKAAPVATHDWLAPIDAAAPCGVDLEYDPEFIVLSSQVAARMEAQYGDFVGSPEPINWSDIDRDCRRLMVRSKDMRLAVLFARCRTRLAGAAGLAEGLGLLAGWLSNFADTIHPQQHADGADGDEEAGLEIRMNALQALADSDGLLGDVREIALPRAGAARLQVRDVERAFAHPRPSDALAPESVTRQLEDVRLQQPDALRSFDSAMASLETIEAWCREHLDAYMPDFAGLSRPLRRIAESRAQVAEAEPVVDEARIEVAETVDEEAASAPANEEASEPVVAPTRTVTRSGTLDRHGALERIREARHWFEQHEPSSPIPVLLRRAESFVGKRYAEAVKAIPVELIEQWEQDASSHEGE
jgi:type VI secretion system protein ImpA